jgi:hypothetical protein
MKKLLILLLAISLPSFASVISTPTTKIVFISSYAQFGGGDVLIRGENWVAGCEGGFFLVKSDPGFSANLSLALSAYHAKTPVVMHGHTEIIWAGSTTKFCKLYGIELQ